MSVYTFKIGEHSIEAHVSSAWSANKSKLKSRSRSKKTKKQNRDQLQRALERCLKLRPASFHSISHTKDFGGFALSNTPVGFDLELASRRVSDAAAKRFGTPRERVIVPDPLVLWVIKEAAFKSLRGPFQPKVISQIRVLKISTIKSRKIFKFSFKSTASNKLGARGHGELRVNSRYIMGIAVSNSQLWSGPAR